jgi:glycosyltransferase involved in cell wall biosynthesis
MSNHTPVAFTVVIPAYNPGTMLREALESIALQTCKAAWTVVIDDGSVDGTEASATRWLSEFGLPGTVLRQPNQGISVARNAGMAVRRSNGVALLDADDIWLPNHLANLTRAFALCPDAVVAFSDSRFFGDARSRTDLLANKIALGLSEHDLGDHCHLMSPKIFDQLLPGQFIPVSASSFRMDCGVPEPRFETELKAGLGEDRYFFLQMARRGRFVFSNEQSCRTRRHESNTTHSDKATWLHENALLLLDKIKLDPGLALTAHEKAIVDETAARTARALLYASSQNGLSAYRRGRKTVSAYVPRARSWSLRDFVRAIAATAGHSSAQPAAKTP